MTAGTSLIISDVHTNYDVINSQIFHAENTHGITIAQVFVLGDFGFFQDKLHKFFRRDGNSFKRPVACIEGNHEDYGVLHKLALDYADVFTHKGRGEIHTMNPWQALCLGGASYMDAAITPRGSEITTKDIDNCLAYSPDEVDLIFTHDCPAGIGVPGASGMEHYGVTGDARLTKLAQRYQPRWWFFGHHHRWFDSVQGGTRYVGLPESWVGYALLHQNGDLELMKHSVERKSRPWWKRWPGFK